MNARYPTVADDDLTGNIPADDQPGAFLSLGLETRGVASEVEGAPAQGYLVSGTYDLFRDPSAVHIDAIRAPQIADEVATASTSLDVGVALAHIREWNDDIACRIIFTLLW